MTASSSQPTRPTLMSPTFRPTSTRLWPPRSSSTASSSPTLTRSGRKSIRSFPAVDIAAYIPGEKHGTREVFEVNVLAAGCKASGALDVIKASIADKAAQNKACVAVRKDGAAVDIDGDYPETLARIAANKTGVGVFGLSFYENNADKLKVATVSGIVPSTETIADGTYPVSRPLFFYVKKAHLGVIPGLKEYVNFFVSDQMIGPDSPLVEYGLVAAPDAERDAIRKSVEDGKTM
jgi:phosphate transport system substrate-binding protein